MAALHKVTQNELQVFFGQQGKTKASINNIIKPTIESCCHDIIQFGLLFWFSLVLCRVCCHIVVDLILFLSSGVRSSYLA